MEINRSAVLKFDKNDDVDNYFIYHEILNTLDKYSDRVFYIDNYLVDGTVEVFQDIEIKTDQVVREKKKEYFDKEFNNTNTVINGPVYKFNSPDRTPEDHKDIMIKAKDYPGYLLGYYSREIEKWVIKAGVRKKFLMMTILKDGVKFRQNLNI